MEIDEIQSSEVGMWFVQGSIAEEFRRELSGLVQKAGVWHVRDRYRWPSFLVSLFHMSRLLISP